MNVENLSTFEKDLLLRWFLYYMPMGREANSEETGATRYALMRDFPTIYNKLAEAEIVQVLQVSTGAPPGQETNYKL